MKKIYGVLFDPCAESAKLIRTYDAEGKEYGQQTGEEIKHSDFDLCYPWCDIRECNILANGTIVYAGGKDFSRCNNTFIEIPAFYFKRTVTENQEEWMISGYPHDGFEIEPWFLDENGRILEHRYIAKYECCSFENGFVSVTGRIPLRYLTIDEFRHGCHLAGFELCSIYAYLAIQHLFVVECATLDSQSVNSGISYVPYASNPACVCQNSGVTNTAVVPYLWRWDTVVPGDVVYLSTAGGVWDISDPREIVSMERRDEQIYITFSGAPIKIQQGVTRIYSSAHASGECDTMKYHNGRPSPSVHTSAFIYRGIENIFGNVWEMADGLTFSEDDSRFAIYDTSLSFTTPANHTYGQSGEGHIKKLGYDPQMQWATLPCELGAKYDSHYCAEWSSFGEGKSIIVFGGGWDHFYCNGIFCMRSIGKADTNWLYGCRAMK